MSDTTKREDDDEPFTHCEGCSRPIFDGENYHAGHDVDLCPDCAPSFADLLAQPESFADAEGEALTSAAAKEIYDAHIAAGGSADDKIGIRS